MDVMDVQLVPVLRWFAPVQLRRHYLRAWILLQVGHNVCDFLTRRARMERSET